MREQFLFFGHSTSTSMNVLGFIRVVTVECGISKCKQREEGERQFSGQFAFEGEEAPSRDLIFITDVGMGAEYIRISLSPHFSVRQHTTKFNFGHLMMGPENLRCHVKSLRLNIFS